jgi:hypothetical protein
MTAITKAREFTALLNFSSDLWASQAPAIHANQKGHIDFTSSTTFLFWKDDSRALTIKFKNSLDLPKKFSKFPQISVKFPKNDVMYCISIV